MVAVDSVGGRLRAVGISSALIRRCARGAAVGVTVLTVAACGAAQSRPAGIAKPDRVSFEPASGSPFGVSITRDGRYAFVVLVPGRLAVYSLGSTRPRLIRTIPLPGEPYGCSLTRDGRLLLVAEDQGAAVVDVALAENGGRRPLLGVLQPPASVRLRADGAIETNSSADGRYVFVSLEYGPSGGAVAVYRLGSDQHPRFGTSDWVGSIPLGQAVVGSALSPNGRQLYVTSELAVGAGSGQSALKKDGSLSVIDVPRAERSPSRAVLATVPAGRQPVRDAVSPNGATVWVTARASDELLAFSAHRLLSQPAKALVGTAKVGTAPVGVALFDNGRRALVADSDRFNAPGAHATLTIVNTHQADRSAVVGTIRAGGFPREIAIDSRNDTALVTNFSSDQVEIVSLAIRG